MFRHQVRAFDVDFPDGPPLFRVAFLDRGHVDQAGVVDEDVQAADCFLDFRGGVRDGGWVCDI